MDNSQRNLVIIYTIVCIALIGIYLLIVSFDFIKKLKFKEKLKLFLLILILTPIICFGIFAVFINIYGFAQMIYKDDFGMIQILTNIPNYYVLYMLIKYIKEESKEK